MQNYLLTQNKETLYFNTLFSAIQAVAAVLNEPFKISPNQDVAIAQALRQVDTEFSYLDVDYDGLAIADEEHSVIATDYAGMFPDIPAKVVLWSNGAGYLDVQAKAEITIIDLKTLNPVAKASGAAVTCDDENLYEAMRTFVSLGITQGPVWNDKVRQDGIDGLMDELVYEYWQQNMESFIEETRRREEIVALYRERFSHLKLIDLISTAYPRFFPLRLAPELLCPKEDIYTALQEQNIAVSVPFKPLYRYDLFKGEMLRSAEQFYKSALALPLDTSERLEAERIADVFVEVIEKYAYRGCSF